MSEVLLHKQDLLPGHPQYLTEVNKKALKVPPKHLRPCPIMIGDELHRIGIVLLLESPENDMMVIPIPFICDTGAPGLLYLGSGSRSALTKLGRIRRDRERNIYHIRGKLLYNNNALNNPEKKKLDERFENHLQNDVRVNLLGLEGMRKLQIDLCIGDM